MWKQRLDENSTWKLQAHNVQEIQNMRYNFVQWDGLKSSHAPLNQVSTVSSWFGVGYAADFAPHWDKPAIDFGNGRGRRKLIVASIELFSVTQL